MARVAGAAAAAVLAWCLPAIAAAHGLAPVYQSQLPLGVYLAGAAATVALSFGFILARDLRAAPSPPGRPVHVPAAVRVGLRVAGLGGWAWAMVQGVGGGTTDAAVTGLFLWVYGWVGVALVSALVFPVWEWLDPFATLFDIGAWAVQRTGLRGWTPSGLPGRLGVWPATAGFAFFVWLQLVVVPGTSALTLVLGGYTLLTLALMAHTGRDAWRAGGETFTVWFRTLNRLAPYGLAPVTPGDPAGESVPALVRRPFASGLLDAEWSTARIVLVALGVASVIFDGVSRTPAYAAVLGSPGTIAGSVELGACLVLVAGLALAAARMVSPRAIGAGLLPIAVGYLTAHYLTYLAIDGQRIVIAVSDPLGTGADLFGTAAYQVQAGWLPPGLVWMLEVVAVVGGHMLGAWAGHVAAQREMEARANARPPRDLRHRKIHTAPRPAVRNVRIREVPLAVVMVALSTLTLWSLGQGIVEEEHGSAAAPAAVSRAL
jgi:hypothetical protein